ncbi:MAG: hypothetical protein E7099_02505 [Mediterranea massiliensis]|nr:hypothetical protein [Mediterranea massiliensis]
MKKIFFTALVCLSVTLQIHAQFVLQANQPIAIAYDKNESQVLHTAIEIFAHDCQTVLSASLQWNLQQPQILIATYGKSKVLRQIIDDDLKSLKDKKQAFLIKVMTDNQLLVAGSDAHGTAYGILELSRLLGVSPWEWWADVTPNTLSSFQLPEAYKTMQEPTVEYRGIFINDEDWGLMPWSYQTYAPAPKGEISAKTSARIFELLLRLRANTYWPAMHECSKPFFLTKGNREMAAKYGIYIGSSHCEPLACNVANEWSIRGKGEYDYVNNSKEVARFFEKRVKEVAGQEILYTLGMRGVHDSGMVGAKGLEQQKEVLARVIQDQRAMLTKYVNRDVTQVPQVFIPYKEVLDIYNAGLQVPDEVTLMWCDDNYGYIRHFPTVEERARKGGNGIYYHVSYWGRPHDYLWLGTFSPYLLYQQMKEAYDRGIQKMWILNVGDIKPIEYQIELFMDMAWNINEVAKQGVTTHLCHFLQREFGNEVGRELLPIMQEHYRLAYIRKPEYMGNTRTEEWNNPQSVILKDLPWSKQTINTRLAAYEQLADEAERLALQVADNRRDAYFHLAKYPVQAAAQMNKKHLFAQLARHGEADWEQSRQAFDSIVALTKIYNEGISNNGKWRYMMDYQPRLLPVFMPVKEEFFDTPLPSERRYLYHWNATESVGAKPITCEGLGYQGKAARLNIGEEYVYSFTASPSDSIEIEIRLLPTHPVDGKQLRLAVSVDGQNEQILPFETQGRSEEWKQNVLRNQAIRRVLLPLGTDGEHRLSIKPLDEGIVLDEIYIY